MEEPVENASSKVTQPNSWVFHRVNSSPIRDRCTPSIAKIKSASATKSRSLTASILLRVTPWKARSAAIISGLGTSPEPANAPEPNGETEFRESQSFIRSTSRRSACECLVSSCEKRIGCACCKCVKPGATTSMYFCATRSIAVARSIVS